MDTHKFQTNQELAWQMEIAERLIFADAHPEQMIPLRQAVGEVNYALILAIDSDDELFE